MFPKLTREGGFLCLFRSKENRLSFPQTGQTTLCSATQRPVTQKPSTYYYTIILALEQLLINLIRKVDLNTL